MNVKNSKVLRPGTKDVVLVKFGLADEPQKATVATMLQLLVLQLPLNGLSMADAVMGKQVVEACAAAQRTLTLTHEQHSWLLGVVEQHGPHTFGIHAATLKEALEAAR